MPPTLPQPDLDSVLDWTSRDGPFPSAAGPAPVTATAPQTESARLTCESVARAGLGNPVKHEGAELIWRCPHPAAHTHGDTHPSLKINPKKDVFMCAPCGVQGKSWALAAFLAGVNAGNKQAVASWLEQRGLLTGARRDLYPSPQSAPAKPADKPQTIFYDYRDAQGHWSYQVCRGPGKKF
jgi:hypothetical protein